MRYGDMQAAKQKLRKAGWRYDRRLRRWEWHHEGVVVVAGSLHEALRMHVAVRKGMQAIRE